MNTKLTSQFRNSIFAVVIVTIFAVGLIEQQEQKSNSLGNEIESWIDCRNSPDAFIQELSCNVRIR